MSDFGSYLNNNQASNAKTKHTKHTKQIRLYPRYKITIYSLSSNNDERYVFTNTKFNGESLDLIFNESQSQLRSFNSSKRLGDVCGSFKLNLSPVPFSIGNYKNITWADILFPMDYIEISTFDLQGQEEPVLWGIIDTVNTNFKVDTQPNANIEIQGRDLGAYFLDQKIYYNKFIAIKSMESANYKLFNALDGLKATDKNIIFNELFERFFKFLIEAVKLTDLSTGEPYNFQGLTYANGKKFTFDESDSLFKKSFSKNNFGEYAVTIQILKENNNFMSMIRKVFNDAFYEIFFDVGGHSLSLDMKNPQLQTALDKKYFHLIIRPRPFDGSQLDDDWLNNNSEKRYTFRDMPAIKIDPVFIHGVNLTRSSTQAYNFFYVFPQGISNASRAQQIESSGMSFIGESVEKFGYRPMEVPLHYASIPPDKGTWHQLCRSMTKTLRNWYEKNPLYYSGTIEIAPFRMIYVGQKIEILWKNKLWWFYVEGVELSVDIQSRSSMLNLTVTRGEMLEESQETQPKIFIKQQGGL